MSPILPRKNQHSSSSFTTLHTPPVPCGSLISIPPVLIPLENSVIPPRMANRFTPLCLPAALNDLPSGYSQRLK